MWTKTVEGIDDINAYTGDSVYVNAWQLQSSQWNILAEYEQIVSYLMVVSQIQTNLQRNPGWLFATIE